MVSNQSPLQPISLNVPARRPRLVKWQRLSRYYYLRLLRLQGSPKNIARGFAVGVFAGFFPFFGFQTILGVALAFVFRGNKIAAAAGTWVSNPFTYAPIYWVNFKVGQVILRSEAAIESALSWSSPAEVFASSQQVAIALLCGCSITGIIFAIATYFFSLRLIERWRHRRSHQNRI
ncbi:MAG: DUF2062 domain-containing protein [Cyanobacteria bacterium P01_H01_bin.15]